MRKTLDQFQMCLMLIFLFNLFTSESQIFIGKFVKEATVVVTYLIAKEPIVIITVEN